MEEEYKALLNKPPSMKSRASQLRMGKHNATKGALPPEVLVVCVGPREALLLTTDRVLQAMRLRAQLQKNMQKKSTGS